jgi:hypothetical protein
MLRIYVHKDINNDICTDIDTHNAQYIYIHSTQKKKKDTMCVKIHKNTMHTKGGSQLQLKNSSIL